MKEKLKEIPHRAKDCPHSHKISCLDCGLFFDCTGGMPDSTKYEKPIYEKREKKERVTT